MRTIGRNKGKTRFPEYHMQTSDLGGKERQRAGAQRKAMRTKNGKREETVEVENRYFRMPHRVSF